MKLKLKLIDKEGRRQAWHHFSTWGLIALAGMPAVWEMVPPDTKERLPVDARDWIQILIALWAVFGKFVDQTPKDKQ